MQRGEPERADGLSMLGARISLVAIPLVLRVVGMEVGHVRVARDLRDHGCGRDGSAVPIAFDHRTHVEYGMMHGREIVMVPVEQHDRPRGRRALRDDRIDGTGGGQTQCPDDADLVDLRGTGPSDRRGAYPRRRPRRDIGSTSLGDELGVAEPLGHTTSRSGGIHHRRGREDRRSRGGAAMSDATASDRLRVVVAAPLAPELCDLLVAREPRIDLVVDQTLLPPMRHPADFSGDPSFRRTPEQQAAYEALIDSAEALYGIPDVDPAALARTVRANPALRWVHTMAAGGGGQVRAAQLTDDELRRVTFTTSAGVHGDALAEFAVFGVFAGAKHLPRLQRQQREREWSGRWVMSQVADQTVLVLGLGGIGQAVARQLAALGTTVIGTSRSGASVPGVSRVIHPDDVAEEKGESAKKAEATAKTSTGESVPWTPS